MALRTLKNPNGKPMDFKGLRNVIALFKLKASRFGFNVISETVIRDNEVINVQALRKQAENLLIRAAKGEHKGQEFANLALKVGVVLNKYPILATPATLADSAVTDTTLTMTWAAVAGASNYILDRSTSATFATYTEVYSGALLTFDDTGLTAETTYYYRVKAQATNYLDSLYKTDTVTTTA